MSCAGFALGRDADLPSSRLFQLLQTAKDAFVRQAIGLKYVLRKKPPGQVLASAHAIEREYRVLSALQNTPVPVPSTICLCTDESVIGTPFYLMRHLQASTALASMRLQFYHEWHFEMLPCEPAVYAHARKHSNTNATACTSMWHRCRAAAHPRAYVGLISLTFASSCMLRTDPGSQLMSNS